MPIYRSHIPSLAFIAGLTTVACVVEKDQQDSGVTTSSKLMALASTCEDVSTNLVAQFRAELAKSLTTGSCGVYSTDNGGIGVPGDGSVSIGGDDVTGGMPTTGVGGSAAAGGSASVSGDDKGEGAGVVTQTNVQVAGVDEGDIVKTDGKNLYVLHDQALELVAASTTGKLTSSAGIALEGLPREMYVIGGATDATRQIVVIADVYGPEIYARAGVAVPINTPGDSGGGSVGPSTNTGVGGSVSVDPIDMPASAGAGATTASGGATGIATTAVSGTPSAVTMAPAPTGPAAGVTSSSYVYGAPRMTKITVLEGTDSSLSVKSQTYYDGYYHSSRRQGTELHTVFGIDKQWPSLRSCPSDAERMKAEMVVLEAVMDAGESVADIPAEKLTMLVGNALVDTVLEQNPAMMDSLIAENYLPRSFVLEGDTLTERKLGCNQLYLPRAGSSVSGVTYVENINLAAPTAASGGRAILGQASLMYENQQALILATNTTEWSDTTLNWGETAYIHRFDVSEEGLTYKTSGVAEGRIKDQFSLDVSGDDLRVVLSEGSRATQKNRLDILRTNAKTGLLTTVGSVTGLGDAEDVKAVRFLGDTAYVVTFVQTDPLYVIDVANGTAPQILGELADIPGFSTYLHPLDDDHLLTIGQDTTNWTPMIQIFDVTDRGAPIQLHSLSMSAYGTSLAMSDYKAFNYYAEQGLLAVPYYQYDGNPRNATLLFDVSVADGLSLIGRVDGDFILNVPENSDTQTCYYYGNGGEMFSRSVFFDDVLFAVAQRGIASVNINAPEIPLDRLVFKSATQTNDYYCDTFATTGGATSVGGAGGAATGGAAGAPVGAGGTTSVD